MWCSGLVSQAVELLKRCFKAAQKLTPLLGQGGVEVKNDGADLTLASNQLKIFFVQ